MAATEAFKGVRTQHPEYIKRLPQWKRCRDAMEGQDAIYAGGTAYLPKLKEQDDDSYKAYQQRAPWYNASWRTTSGLVGMMFRKPPAQEFPAKLDEYKENIDLSGNSLDRFVQDIAIDVLEVGRLGLLTDYPKPPVLAEGQVLSLAEAEALGNRPVLKTYMAESIINWKHRNIKNATVLSMVVLVEVVPNTGDDEFSQDVKTQYRVLDLDENNEYRVRVYEVDKENKDALVEGPFWPVMDGKRLGFIPFVFIGADGTKACAEAPPQIDLVDLNISHFKTTADYEHGCHFSGLPTFFVAGASATTDANGKQDKIYIGSQTAIILNDPQAKAGFAEIQGDFEALRKNLDAKKQEMATLGARMLADSSEKQVETFGATAIKHVAENSILASIAISISTGVKQALEWFCKWGGMGETKIVFEINRDYLPVQMDSATLTAIMAAWQGGMLSEQEMFELLKRGDVIDASKTLEEHQEEIDSAPPPAPPSNAQPGRLGTPTQEEKDTQAAAAAADIHNATGGG